MTHGMPRYDDSLPPEPDYCPACKHATDAHDLRAFDGECFDCDKEGRTCPMQDEEVSPQDCTLCWQDFALDQKTDHAHVRALREVVA